MLIQRVAVTVACLVLLACPATPPVGTDGGAVTGGGGGVTGGGGGGNVTGGGGGSVTGAATLSVNETTWAFTGVTPGAPASTHSFTFTNTGGRVSAALVATVVGDGFSVMTGGCAAALEPAATCTVELAFAPSTLGSRSGRLTVTDGSTASATVLVTGTGLAPASLSVVPASGSSADFGGVVVAATATQTFTVTNVGETPVQMLATSVTGAQATAFAVVTPSGTECTTGMMLAPGASCAVQVRLTAVAGELRTNLRVAGMPGGEVLVALRARGLNPAQLSSVTSMHDFGQVEAGVRTAPFTWVLSNAGDVATGALSIMLPSGAWSLFADSCTGVSLGGGQSCSVGVVWTPEQLSTGGTLTASATPGGSATLDFTGLARLRLTIATDGSGTVEAPYNSLSGCGAASCTALVFPGSQVLVRAINTNGSNSRFVGWTVVSGSTGSTTCGSLRECTFDAYEPVALVAHFKPIEGNLIFVSSTPVLPNLGISGFDQRCNTLATAAGINNLTNDGYLAWASTASLPLATRWTVTGGLERIDGRPFALSRAALFANRVINPNDLDENGVRVSGQIWTGTDADGTASLANCSAWTDVAIAAQGQQGSISGGPVNWSALGNGVCSDPTAHLACVQNRSNITLLNPALPSNAKLIYLTPEVPRPTGRAAADAICAANKPASFTSRTFVALLATVGTSSGSRVNAQAPYYRPDGALVSSSGTALSAGDAETGLWLFSDGTPIPSGLRAWTGSTRPSTAGTNASTCNDWTSGTGTVELGSPDLAGASVFGSSGNTQAACAGTAAIICVEP